MSSINYIIFSYVLSNLFFDTKCRIIVSYFVESFLKINIQNVLCFAVLFDTITLTNYERLLITK